jgi:DNA-binding winged helix-turn-helix (wHTH) protein
VRTRFGDFILDAGTRQLQRGGAALHLSPKAFDLLAILLEQRPRVVSKDELRDRLWGTTNVLDANLNNLASEIRSVLDDDPQQPRFLRTAHRVGYAFCGTASDEPRADAADRSPRAWLLWNERTLPIEPAIAIIGRDPKCDIWIDAPGVSRRHASIRLVDEGTMTAAVLEDLGSTNGTFVEGRPVTQPVTLEDGQAIAIGEATVTFRTWSSAASPTKRIKRRRPGVRAASGPP